MDIRTANLEDINEINDLFKLVKEQMWRTNVFQWPSNYPTKENVQFDIARQSLIKLVRNQKVITVGTLYKINQTDFVIKRLATHPDYISKGYASLFLNEIINKIEKSKGERIYLSTNHTNISMQNFLVKHEFEKISEYVEKEREYLGFFYKYVKKI